MPDREQNGCRRETSGGEKEASRRRREVKSEESYGRSPCAGSRGHSRSRQPAREATKRRQRRTARPPSPSECRQHERTGGATFRQRTTPHLRYCAGHAGTAQDERIRVGIFRTCLAHDSVCAQAASIMGGHHGCGAGRRTRGCRRRQHAGQSWQHPRDGLRKDRCRLAWERSKTMARTLEERTDFY